MSKLQKFIDEKFEFGDILPSNNPNHPYHSAVVKIDKLMKTDYKDVKLKDKEVFVGVMPEWGNKEIMSVELGKELMAMPVGVWDSGQFLGIMELTKPKLRKEEKEFIDAVNKKFETNYKSIGTITKLF
jgi:hypothetical protein